MKFRVISVILCFLVPAVLGISEELKKLGAKLHATCVGKTGVDEDNTLINKVNAEKVFENDDKLMYYMKCLFEQTGTINDDGTVDEDATIAIMPDEVKERASVIIRACGTKVGANPCENAWLIHICYLEQDPEMYTLL